MHKIPTSLENQCFQTPLIAQDGLTEPPLREKTHGHDPRLIRREEKSGLGSLTMGVPGIGGPGAEGWAVSVNWGSGALGAQEQRALPGWEQSSPAATWSGSKVTASESRGLVPG